MIPHERSLVEKYKDRPFAIVGVNTDSSKDEYAKKAAEQKVTWRSAWTGSHGVPTSTAVPNSATAIDTSSGRGARAKR